MTSLPTLLARRLRAVSACVVVTLGGTSAFAQAGATPVPAPTPGTASSAPAVDDSLYRALGAQAGIDRITNDFVARLPTDPRLGEFFKKSNLVHLQQMLSLQFCEVSGGSCVYTGIPMKTAHQNMDIAKSDFNALVETLQSAMDAQGIAFSTQNQLLARLAPMHRDIVNVH